MSSSKFRDVFLNIKVAVMNLPKPIRRVCYVQLFAFMGWWVPTLIYILESRLTLVPGFRFCFIRK